MKFDYFFKKNDSQIAAQIKAATNIAMDDAAREKTRTLLSEYAHMRPIRSVKAAENTAAVYNPLSTFFTRHSIPAFATVLVLAVGGGTAAAAESALPGDILYPVKVNVTEEVRATLATTAKAKATWALNRAERRLEEAATLALVGKLDDKTRAAIDTNIDAHVRSAGEKRGQLESENELSDASEVETNIDAVLFARENILHGARGAKVAAQAKVSPDAIATMSARVEPQEIKKDESRKDTEDFEQETKGHRAAAKARIEATKKFLDHSSNRLSEDTRKQAKVRLEAAAEAFSSGDEDDERGNKEGASSNFNSALEAATEIEAIISISDDSEERKTDLEL